MQAVIIIIMVPLFTPNVHVGYMLKVGSNFCTFGGMHNCILMKIRNSYITGARDVRHLLHRSPRAHARGMRAINAVHPERARDITSLYPEGTATIATTPCQRRKKCSGKSCA